MKNLNPETSIKQQVVALEPNDTRYLANLCGQYDENLRHIERRLEVTIKNRGNIFQLEGFESNVHAASKVLVHLYAESNKGIDLTPDIVHLSLQESGIENLSDGTDDSEDNIASISSIRTRKSLIRPRGQNQKNYVQAVRQKRH